MLNDKIKMIKRFMPIVALVTFTIMILACASSEEATERKYDNKNNSDSDRAMLVDSVPQAPFDYAIAQK